eukprot:jgi/Ulvmu1/8612/UM046_0010.1
MEVGVSLAGPKQSATVTACIELGSGHTCTRAHLQRPTGYVVHHCPPAGPVKSAPDVGCDLQHGYFTVACRLCHMPSCSRCCLSRVCVALIYVRWIDRSRPQQLAECGKPGTQQTSQVTQPPDTPMCSILQAGIGVRS